MGRKYKTKFPMARIKKIMQLDNEIGKVALATPILISKALEVFMQNLVDEACKRVQAGGSTKLEPVYLKQCINETEEFDFLKDIVANVDDTPTTVQNNNNSDEVKGSTEVSDSVQEIKEDDCNSNLNHKCPISTILNEDHVSPLLKRSEIVDSNEDINAISDKLSE